MAETNIIDTIYQLRYLKDAVKVLLPKKRRKELKQQSKYHILDIDEVNNTSNSDMTVTTL